MLTGDAVSVSPCRQPLRPQAAGLVGVSQVLPPLPGQDRVVPPLPSGPFPPGPGALRPLALVPLSLMAVPAAPSQALSLARARRSCAARAGAEAPWLLVRGGAVADEA